MSTVVAPPTSASPRPNIGTNTPEELRQLILKTALFMPGIEKPEFVAKKELYRLYLDLLELDYLKLQKYIDRHGHNEPDPKYMLRQKLAACFNLVPTVLNLIKLYLFSEDPSIDVKGDQALEAFLKDCDGNGTPWIRFCRNKALPLSMLFGMIDVLVQNPLLTANPMSEADAQAEGITPRSHIITPLQRINWSCQPNDAYNWVCFIDRGNEDAHPLRRNVKPLQAYITLSAANTDLVKNPKGDTGFWIRSWRPLDIAGTGTPPLPPQPIPTGAVSHAQWQHEADWCPTKRVPVATLTYQESVDPDSRHDGVSKVAMIAALTRLIIQVLSWVNEDVLANLAMLAMPSQGGRQPEGFSAQTLDAFTILWYSDQAKNPPHMVQGSKDHIEIKLRLIELCLREILRLAHMIGASGEVERVTSGVQGQVMRTELHQELKDTAESLDNFSLDVFALVKSWATGEDWDRQRLMDEIEPTVDWFKGPYGMDPIENVVKDTSAVLEMFRDISPTLVEASLKQVARAVLPNADQDLPKSLSEIEANTGKILADQAAMLEAASAAAAVSGRQSGNVTIQEDGGGGGGAGA